MISKKLIENINNLPDNIIVHIYEYCQKEKQNDVNQYCIIFKRIFFIFFFLFLIYGTIFGLGFILTRQYSGIFIIVNIFLGGTIFTILIFCIGFSIGFKNLEIIINRLDLYFS